MVRRKAVLKRRDQSVSSGASDLASEPEESASQVGQSLGPQYREASVDADDTLSQISYYTRASETSENEERLARKVAQLEEHAAKERAKIDAMSEENSRYKRELEVMKRSLEEAGRRAEEELEKKAEAAEREASDGNGSTFYRDLFVEGQERYERNMSEMQRKVRELEKELKRAKSEENKRIREASGLQSRVQRLSEGRRNEYQSLRSRLGVHKAVSDVNLLKRQNEELRRQLVEVERLKGQIDLVGLLDWVFGFLTGRFLEDPRYGIV